MVTTETTRFANIAAFYEARGGARSGESDFGVQWLETKGGPRHRVSVVHDTGDVYAKNLIDETVELLGTIPGNCSPSGLTHEAHVCAYEKADKLFAGWSDEQRPLSWIRERLS